MNTKTLRAFLVGLSLVPLSTLAAGAAEGNPGWAWQVQWENDTLSGTDENYTNGLRISFFRNPEFTPEPAESFARGWCNLVCKEAFTLTTFGWAIGQNFYTPEDIEQVEQVPDERPWAGWLYGGLTVHITEQATEGESRFQHAFEVDFGVVGPPAQAEPVQKFVHEHITGSAEPLGWDNQISTEPTINFNYLYRKILKTRSRFDFTPHLGLNVGNVQTFANLGATLRLGNHISAFPIGIISTTVYEEPKREKSEWYFFVAADGRAFARNIFLDGNTFRDSHSVDSETFVYDLKAGFSYRFLTKWRINYTYVRRSEEFPPPSNQADGIHEFASLSFSFEPSFRQ